MLNLCYGRSVVLELFQKLSSRYVALTKKTESSLLIKRLFLLDIVYDSHKDYVLHYKKNQQLKRM
ncbi:hypothetical protein IGI56_000415 [Enterococcus sp. AZ192]